MGLRQRLNADRVAYKAPLAGASERMQQDKNREYVSVSDFAGYDPTGGTDSTAAIIAALAASKHVVVPDGHTPLISSTIVIPSLTTLEFRGAHSVVSGSHPGSYFIKKATMVDNGIEMRDYSRISGGGLIYQAGATGDGIAVQGNSCRMNNVAVIGVDKATPSGVGIRVGKDAAGANANSWQFTNCNVAGMSGHGFYVHDKPGLPPDANAGNAIGCFSMNNGGDGFNVDNANLCTFHGCLGELNTGNGIVFGTNVADAAHSYCYGNIILGGDYEMNTAGQVLLNRGARNCGVHSGNVGLSVVDNGYRTQRLDLVQGKRRSFTPALTGTTAVSKAITAYSIVGNTATLTVAGHGYANAKSVWIRYFNGGGKENLNGVFVISNVTVDTFDITIGDDVTFVQPSGAGAVAGPMAVLCGTYSTAQGSYRIEQDRIFFEAAIVTTDISNITGTVQLILPFPAANLGALMPGHTEIESYSGVTHTGKLGCIIWQDGNAQQKFYQSIGSGLAPGLLTNAGLAAATSFYISGWYFSQ
ncbi:hypothetical protein [Geothrix campi]|uniref:hypothetical protein n=1 Tax=Geothrix campi TaxID=2966450 RepID=UPI00214774DF|nr:hypothetical protein [Geothrix sp. SG10]